MAWLHAAHGARARGRRRGHDVQKHGAVANGLTVEADKEGMPSGDRGTQGDLHGAVALRSDQGARGVPRRVSPAAAAATTATTATARSGAEHRLDHRADVRLAHAVAKLIVQRAHNACRLASDDAPSGETVAGKTAVGGPRGRWQDHERSGRARDVLAARRLLH